MQNTVNRVGVGLAFAVLLTACGDRWDSGPDPGPDAYVKPYIRTLPHPVHISHRGGADVAPENTLYAFDVAVNQYGTHVLETDLNITADGEIILIHDRDVDDTTEATGFTEDMTLAEIKTLDAAYRFDPDRDQTYPLRGQGITIPTLAEAFEAFPQMHFNLEVKDWEPVPFEGLVVEVVQAYGMEERVCWGSSNDESAERLRALAPEVCIYYPMLAATCFALAVINGDDPFPDCERYDALVLPESGATEDLIQVARRESIPVYVWTIDDRSMMEQLFERGVDGIMTDRPDTLRDVIDNL